MTETEGPAKPHVLRRLYNWILSWADTPYGPLALAVLAFCESSFFPIPPDPLLMALALGARKRSLRFAALCTAASVFGGLLGYAIGASAFQSIGAPILEAYGKTGDFESLAAQFRAQGEVAVLVSALTPIPYKLVTITSGVVGMNLPAFIGASVLGRGLRFFLVAGLIWWRGEAIRGFIDKYFEILSILFAVLLIGGFAIVRYLP